MYNDALFADGYLSEWLQARLDEALQAAREIPPDKALAVPEPDLVEELMDRYKVNPPQLFLEKKYSRGAQDVKVDVSKDRSRFIRDRSRPCYVPGTRIEIRVPFSGDPELFKYTPSNSTTMFPRARVEGMELVIWHEAPADSLKPEEFQSHLNREIELVQQYLERVAEDCKRFHAALESQLRKAVQQRKQKVLQDRNLEAYLKVPVLRRPDASPVFAVPLERRGRAIQKVVTPDVTEPFSPEPAISDEAYAEILDVIGSYRDLVERLPRTFSQMQEEVLRDILLVVLNNQFGPSGGEVFSRNGKTDIFLWYEKGAIFIAECKFWKGGKAFEGALEQLLSYLVWRDTKAALILFVRQKSVSDIMAKADQALKKHRRYKRVEENVSHFPIYVFHHEGDRNREIKVALVVVPLPRD